MKEKAGWCLWMTIAILLIVIGFTGRLGKVFAVAFAPGIIDTSVYGGGSSGDFGP